MLQRHTHTHIHYTHNIYITHNKQTHSDTHLWIIKTSTNLNDIDIDKAQFNLILHCQRDNASRSNIPFHITLMRTKQLSNHRTSAKRQCVKNQYPHSHYINDPSQNLRTKQLLQLYIKINFHTQNTYFK